MRFSSVSTSAGDTLAVRRDDGLYDLRQADPGLPDGVGALVAGGQEAVARATKAAASVTGQSLLDEGSVKYRPLLERPPGRVGVAADSVQVASGARLRQQEMHEYGDEKRANQVAWAAVKHSFEKVGDHWEKKAGGRKGPSDAQAAGGRNTGRKTKGGVDANAPKEHLLKLAKKLDVSGRSTMKKKELVDAIQKANTRKTADARKKKK